MLLYGTGTWRRMVGALSIKQQANRSALFETYLRNEAR